jgi:protein TonB
VAAPPPVAKPVERAVVRTPPSTAGKGARTSLPEYPPASRRAGEAGTVQLRCFVQESGKCTEVTVVKSSGFEKLDEAAVKEVQRNWKFVPGKEDGKPVAMWHTFAVTFRLTD